jgi:transposase-like protein
MKPYTRYTEDFKEQALAKVFNRGNDQSIQAVANDLNICLQTLTIYLLFYNNSLLKNTNSETLVYKGKLAHPLR